MSDMLTLNIIGCGRAAGTLAKLGIESGRIAVNGVMNRSASSSSQAIGLLGQGWVVENASDFDRADLWMIGASDDQIEPAAQALAFSGLNLADEVVFHLCGRFGPEVLDPLRPLGAELAAVHPVRSLTHEAISLDEFAGTPCVAEGNPVALRRARPFFKAIRAGWMSTGKIDRGLYHAAVSIISNITKGIAWKSQVWLQDAGLSREMASVVNLELLGSTLSDLKRYGARKSITGPIVRGDTQTIEAHIEALGQAHPDDVDVYRILARTVLEMARERGDLSEETMARFREILNG